MKLSEEMAVRLHRMMWSDMQKELGDKPNFDDRIEFKKDWCKKNFPGERFEHNCFLCEYVRCKNDVPYESRRIGIGSKYCEQCPINWPNDRCTDVFFDKDHVNYGTSPISEILALPARNESFAKKAANIHDLSRDIVVGEVAKASGLPVECDIWTHIKKIQDKAQDTGFKTTKNELAVHSGLDVDATLWEHIRAIQDGNYTFKAVKKTLSEASGIGSLRPVEDHIKAIQHKAVQQSTFSKMYCDAKTELAKASGLPEAEAITDHIKAIQEKAVEEYFAKKPGAKLATMDVDNAFKQYADEQKAPIFKALSKASGLSEHNHNVFDHINWIKLKGEQDIHHALKEEKASIFKELAAESGLYTTATVKAHINAIYSNGFDNGKDAERERILDKIQEMLKK